MPGYSPATVFPFALTGLGLAANIWVIIVGQKYSFTLRIVSAFLIQALLLVIIPFLANIGGTVGYWSVFAILFLLGLIGGIGGSSMFSMAGGLPPKYMGVMFLGQGITGILINILRAITLISWPSGNSEHPENAFIGVLALFLFAAFLQIICALAQFELRKNEFAVYHLW
jgi:hypothetical protein